MSQLMANIAASCSISMRFPLKIETNMAKLTPSVSLVTSVPWYIVNGDVTH